MMLYLLLADNSSFDGLMFKNTKCHVVLLKQAGQNSNTVYRMRKKRET